MEISELRLKAIMMGSAAHATKTYSGQPYYTHLYDVYRILVEYGFESNESLMVASFLHDTMEDAGFTYNDIKKVFGRQVADIIYLVTDFKGHNRDERKPDQLYLEMRLNVLAIILKVADRIANARRSVASGHSMGDKYKAEYGHFREMLHNEDHRMLAPMWNELDGLMGYGY